MSDEPEILPPGRRSLPAKREERGSVPAEHDDTVAQSAGVVVSALTGFGARVQARAYRDIAENIRAQKDALDAEVARRDSSIKLLRKTGELLDIKEILKLDKAERAAERAEQYAGLTAKYDNIDDTHDERAHQRRLTQLRRQREIEEANTGLVEAKRATFGATEGLESQERLKQLNLEMWEKRAATEQLDAEKIWLLLKREVDGMKSPQQKTADGSLGHLAEMREGLVKQAQEAAASGDASKAEKYERLAAELDEMVVTALRGQSHSSAQR